MATPNTARIIDLETDQSEAQASLQFQDFSDTLTGATGALPGQAYTSFSVMNDDDEESDELLNREKGDPGGQKGPSFWKFAYYQSLFDVTTDDVLRRLTWSALPQLKGPTYLEKHIQPNPDLYGNPLLSGRRFRLV
ncbi:hypothetical protein ISCGN_031333 [Ixodes scapularis]